MNIDDWQYEKCRRHFEKFGHATCLFKILVVEQTQNQLNICTYLLQQAEADKNFEINCYCWWDVVLYDVWCQSEAAIITVEIKIIPKTEKLIVCFDCRGLVYYMFIPRGQSESRIWTDHGMSSTRCSLKEMIGMLAGTQLGSSPWHTHTHTYTCMCAQTLILLCVQKFSVKNPATLGHGLSPTDLFLFLKFKVSLKGCSFESVEEIYI